MSLFDVLPYDSEEFKEAWSDWKEHRKHMKEPLGPVAIKRQLNFLKGLGEQAAIKSIDNSINHNWTGLFPPRMEEKPKEVEIWTGKIYGS